MAEFVDQDQSAKLSKAARPTRRALLFSAAWAFIATPVWAADASAVAFVTDIYEAYKGSGAKGHSLDSERAVRRYFEPSLAASIIKDVKRATRRGETGRLDGDPFVDAQDWNIDNFDIAVTDAGPGKARATVKFTNLDRPATVVLDLIKSRNDWRISDITWLRDGKPETLRALYKR